MPADELMAVAVRLLPPPKRALARPQTSSTDEACVGGRDDAARKRQPTYDVRRQTIADLQTEVRSLRTELYRLHAKHARAQVPLVKTVDENALLQKLIAQNQLKIATAQSLVSSSSLVHGTQPIGSYVRLPADPALRQRITDGLKAHKIQEAVQFMVARSRFTDLRRPSLQLDKYETANGDHILNHWEVARIAGAAATVATVFEELLYFKSTLEMTLAEKLGVMSVRENDSASDGLDAAQMRAVYNHECGLPVENNYVYFSQYFARSDALEQPHAIVVVDYVDQDDAFPYQPQSRIRKDISSATMIVPCPPQAPGALPAVTILEWSYVRIHKNAIATVEELDLICRDSVRAYFDLLVKTVRERVAWRAQAR